MLQWYSCASVYFDSQKNFESLLHVGRSRPLREASLVGPELLRLSLIEIKVGVIMMEMTTQHFYYSQEIEDIESRSLSRDMDRDTVTCYYNMHLCALQHKFLR
jgi:hypothetical protein